ncbi:MAG TPA: branched-chain amino acid ABC transporter substrate-binding protein [Acidimicrobiales bacterium]|nr:branched-chain amino acid ABC transporter substrate-binding protein [Acidimicrobiales bacterium]
MSHARSRLLRSLALFAIGGLLLAGCGGDDEEESGGGDAGDATLTVKIGLIAPLSGSLSALGLGMRNSADLAIKQANEEGKVEGWRIVFQPEDDTAKADVGAQVATKLASDSQVAAVIGTLNSSVALQVQPILSRANIAMISPANTGTALTMGDDPSAKKRPYNNYFRVCTNDAVQGPFAADYAYDTLGARTAVLIHDKKAYGQGLTQEFQKRFTSKGGRVLATETINPGDQDFSAVVSKIRPLNPAVVYYGGEYPEAAPLSNQLKQGGVKAPLMGGDGIYDATYIQNAGPSAEGDLATSVGAPPEKLDSAKQFIEDYQAAKYSEAYSAYGPQAYDAANVIIEALAKVLEDKETIDDATRQEIVEAIQDTNLKGVTGDVTFDEFGDTTTRLLTVYKVQAGAWKDVETGEFE